jgi:hypothetical protein
MPAASTPVATVTVNHESFCLPQTARGDGPAAEPRIEQFKATGADRDGKERTLLVTRCLECGAAEYRTP